MWGPWCLGQGLASPEFGTKGWVLAGRVQAGGSRCPHSSASLTWNSSSDSLQVQRVPAHYGHITLGTGTECHCPWGPCSGLIPGTGSEIPLAAPRAGLLPTGSAGILGAGRGRPSLEPWFNPNSPGTNFSPPLPFLFFFFPPSSINGWKCFRFWQRALDVAVSDGSRGLRPGNLWG